MYTTLDFAQIKANPELVEKYKGFKLCYVDSISPTVYDYDKESREIINSPGFSWKDYDLNCRRLRMEDQPNPDFVPNEKEIYMYFTPIDLDDQWGDDWDDAPYEHNAGAPYDDTNINGKRTEYEILIVPTAIKSYNWCTPEDRGFGGNSPFAVADINHGAVAWIYDVISRKTSSKYVAIQGGDTLFEVEKKILQIAENNKEQWVPKGIDEYEY
jgi:hypothetical protein